MYTLIVRRIFFFTVFLHHCVLNWERNGGVLYWKGRESRANVIRLIGSNPVDFSV
jgi:hypothetical protein